MTVAVRFSVLLPELYTYHRSKNLYSCAAGGSDQYVHVYDLRRLSSSNGSSNASSGINHTSAEPIHKLRPRHMSSAAQDVHVTCVKYSRHGELLASYNDENVYLFEHLGAQQSAARPTVSPAGCSSAKPRDDGPCQESADGGAMDSQPTSTHPDMEAGPSTSGGWSAGADEPQQGRRPSALNEDEASNNPFQVSQS